MRKTYRHKSSFEERSVRVLRSKSGHWFVSETFATDSPVIGKFGDREKADEAARAAEERLIEAGFELNRTSK